jgi:hypothetical protein
MMATRAAEFCQSDDTTGPQGGGSGNAGVVWSAAALVRGERLGVRQSDYCSRTRASREDALQTVR